MTEKSSIFTRRLAVAVSVLTVTGLLTLWMAIFVRESRLLQAQDDFIQAVKEGNVNLVVELLNSIDPTWAGTAEDWTGDQRLNGQGGFSWMIEQWMGHGHTRGIADLHQIRLNKAPGFPRSELLGPLEWLSGQGDRESLEAYFAVLLETPYSQSDPNDDPLHERILAHAERDVQLALLTWEARDAGKFVVDVPDRVFATAIRRSGLADPGVLARVLRLTGLLEPAESFVVCEAPPVDSWRVGKSWIERIFRSLANLEERDAKSAREILERSYFSNISAETPGLFLLNRLFLDSAESPTGEHMELSPGEIETALAVFDRLSPQGKAGIAILMDRLIPDYEGHESLRQWVGKHLRMEWLKQRERILALSIDQADAQWDSEVLQDWLLCAAKHGFSEESTEAVMHIYRLREKKRTSRRQLQVKSARDNHPFFLSTIDSLWTRRGTPPLPAQFSLLLSFASEPTLPPSDSFPILQQMGYRKANGSYVEAPWYPESAEELNEEVTRLGEPFVDHPLRFLLVPFFYGSSNNFPKILRKPEELAAFQVLAASNDRPGGWLAKDLADLFPRWWCSTKVAHDELLAKGGHSFSYDRVYGYIDSRATPVAARVSYALGIFDWHAVTYMRDRSTRLGAAVPYFPDLSKLSLEFANEYKRGRWSEESISEIAWERIVSGWLSDESISDSGDPEFSQGAARQAILSRLTPYVREKIAVNPHAEPGVGKAELDGAMPLLKLYANLLQLEGDIEGLATLWDGAELALADPRKIFSSFPVSRGDRAQILGGVSADIIVRRYRDRGWEGAREQVSKMNGDDAYSALSEATSRLSLSEWVEFCSHVLEFKSESGGPGQNGWDRFCAIPPEEFVKVARSMKDNERIQFIARELSDIEIPRKHVDFFALALPLMLRNCMSRGDLVEDYSRAITEFGNGKISPLILQEIGIACGSTESVVESRHLQALQSRDVPLAQRWIGSNFFHLSRSDRALYFSNLKDWPIELKALTEVGLDLLVDAIDHEMPIWVIMDRGLGSLDHSSWHSSLSVSSFASLYRLDREAQGFRASKLTEASRIIQILRNHPDRKSMLNILFGLSLNMGDQPLSVDLFVEAEPILSFEEKLKWLSLGEFFVPIGRLFAKEWPRVAELSVGFGHFFRGGDLDAILGALPEDRDLRRLVKATLQHSSMSTGLVNGGSSRVSDSQSELVSEFLREEFKSSRMEAICLTRLPVRMEQYPRLGEWLDERLKGCVWETMLSGQSASIRSDWPYWARKIEDLAGSGDFETLGQMLPSMQWFASRPRPFDDGVESPDSDSIEEMVWMGFARVVAYHMRYGSYKDRLAAAGIAARLLSSPPDSKRRNEVLEPSKVTSLRPNSFHAGAAQQLWLYAVAGTLSATMDEPAEAAVKRCDQFELPLIPSIVNDTGFSSVGHQGFFRLLADFAEKMLTDERTDFFLRGLETGPLSLNAICRALPCYSLARIQLPSKISRDDMVKLARIRSESVPASPMRIADLGLVLQLAGDDVAALPLLEQALSRLDPGNSESRPVIEVTKAVFIRLSRARGRVAPPPRGGPSSPKMGQFQK